MLGCEGVALSITTYMSTILYELDIENAFIGYTYSTQKLKGSIDIDIV